MAENRSKGLGQLFAENLSVKGVPKIAKSKSVCQKLLWVFAVLVGTSVAVIQLYSLLASYFRYSSSFSVTASTDTAEFPDVTVCNLNPLWVSEYRGNYSHTMEEISYGTLLEIVKHIENERFDNINLLLPVFNIGGYIQNLDVLDMIQKVQNSSTFIIQSFYLNMNNKVDFTKRDHKIKNVFVPKYGPCFTFQTQDSLGKVGDLSTPNKLTAILFLNNFQEEVLSNFFVNPWGTYASGARVVIHPKNTFPDMDEGINVSPGTEVTFRLQAEYLRRLGHPYSVCTKNITMETLGDHYTYTPSACQMLCIQRKIIEECGCLNFDYIVRPDQIGTYPFCGYVNVSDPTYQQTYASMNCTLRVVFRVLKEHQCTCLTPCKQRVYQTQVFQAPWPHEAFQLSFLENVVKIYQPDVYAKFKTFRETFWYLYFNDRSKLYPYLRSEDIITRNFLQLNVELQVNNTRRLTEVPTWTLASVVGTIGGLLNLWVGITFITAIEVLDVFFIRMGVQKGRGRTNSDGIQGHTGNVHSTSVHM